MSTLPIKLNCKPQNLSCVEKDFRIAHPRHLQLWEHLKIWWRHQISARASESIEVKFKWWEVASWWMHLEWQQQRIIILEEVCLTRSLVQMWLLHNLRKKKKWFLTLEHLPFQITSRRMRVLRRLLILTRLEWWGLQSQRKMKRKKNSQRKRFLRCLID